MRLRLRISKGWAWSEVGDSQQETSPRGLRFWALAALLAVFFISTAAVSVVFAKNGLLARHLGLDLAFLFAPLIAFNTVLLAGSIVRRLVPGDGGRLASLFVKGTAFAFVLYVLVHDLSRIETALAAAPELEDIAERAFGTLKLGVLSSLGVEAILLIVGITLIRLPSIPLKLRHVREDILAACLSSAGVVLIAFVVREVFSAYSAFYGPLATVGTILLVSLVFVAVGAALRPFGDTPNPILAGLCQWIARSQLRNFVFGGFLATYFLTIRPAVFDVLVYALIFEWILVLAVVWRLYAGLRGSIGQATAMAARPLPYEGWQRHRQRISQTNPEFLTYFREIQEKFLDEGIKDHLLVQVIGSLWENGLRQWEITRIVGPLLEYRDALVPFPRFPWEERWINRRNRRNRQQVLNGTLELLDRVVTEGQRFRVEVNA